MHYLINGTVYRFPNQENYYGLTSALWLQPFPSKLSVGLCSAVLCGICTVFASLAICILVSPFILLLYSPPSSPNPFGLPTEWSSLCTLDADFGSLQGYQSCYNLIPHSPYKSNILYSDDLYASFLFQKYSTAIRKLLRQTIIIATPATRKPENTRQIHIHNGGSLTTIDKPDD